MEVVGAYIKRLHKSLQCVGFIAIVSTTFYSVLELILKITKVRIKSLNKLFINFTSDIPFSKKKIHLGGPFGILDRVASLRTSRPHTPDSVNYRFVILT